MGLTFDETLRYIGTQPDDFGNGYGRPEITPELLGGRKNRGRIPAKTCLFEFVTDSQWEPERSDVQLCTHLRYPPLQSFSFFQRNKGSTS
jgi:hypothetical protein